MRARTIIPEMPIPVPMVMVISRPIRSEIRPGLSIAVELTGLSDTEADDLASLMNELSARAPGQQGADATGPQEAPAYVATTT